MEKNELSRNARGGTELMLERLHNSFSSSFLENFQIIPSRVRDLDETKIRVLWIHDLPGDPESEHLKNGGWKKFHALVFVSNWQMQAFINYYKIPWSKCMVMPNAIEPIDFDMVAKNNRDTIKLVYHTTPHRGLQILVPVFEKLCENYSNLELNVFSSFNVYGWAERDEQYKDLFEQCKNHPKINYYGAVPNEQIREELKHQHIYAYPSIWMETSCISLIEAASAGVVCVHPNFGALYETAANWTHMYQFDDNMQQHASMFYSVLKSAIDEIQTLSDNEYRNKIMTQKSYFDVFYNWSIRKRQWEAFLNSLLDLPREIPKEKDLFVYKVL